MIGQSYDFMHLFSYTSITKSTIMICLIMLNDNRVTIQLYHECDGELLDIYMKIGNKTRSGKFHLFPDFSFSWKKNWIFEGWLILRTLLNLRFFPQKKGVDLYMGSTNTRVYTVLKSTLKATVLDNWLLISRSQSPQYLNWTIEMFNFSRVIPLAFFLFLLC